MPFPELIADHPALDFLNTLAKIDGTFADSLQGDQDVLTWLGHAGLPVPKDGNYKRGRLLDCARGLRQTIRTAVERRKSGKPLDPHGLNEWLSQGRSYLKLVVDQAGEMRVNRRWKRNSAEQILAPVAEAAAELLATGDFKLVRRCEGAGCVLWFYDRTKSHQRRWCSMAACGNRNKVAVFRQRHQRESDR
ncbi:MAG TPA: ABATE domain-containing protein [Bryobacteraceae bacterium]|jgi:predicted RNA-binding Zn ribbon-like protein